MLRSDEIEGSGKMLKPLKLFCVTALVIPLFPTQAASLEVSAVEGCTAPRFLNEVGVCVAPPAFSRKTAERWGKVDFSTKSIYYIDINNVKVASDVASFSYLDGFKDPRRGSVYYAKLDTQVRCSSNEFRFGSIIEYDAEAKVLDEIPDAGLGWNKINQASTMGALRAVVCDGSQTTPVGDPFADAKSWRIRMNDRD